MLRSVICFFCFLFSIFLIPSMASAGGEEFPEATYIPPPPVYSGFYFEGQLGYILRDWQENLPYQTLVAALQGGGPPFGQFVESAKGGFTSGVILGYQWNRYFGAEIGWFHFPRFRYIVPPGLIVAGGMITEHSWMGYAAFKLMFPIYGSFYAFSKVGAAGVRIATNLTFIPVSPNPISGDFWSPLFAVGLEYYVHWNWSVLIQYLHINGYERRPANGVFRKLPSPNSDLFTVGLAYKLAI